MYDREMLAIFDRRTSECNILVDVFKLKHQKCFKYLGPLITKDG